jgi:hypothetical protein
LRLSGAIHLFVPAPKCAELCALSHTPPRRASVNHRYISSAWTEPTGIREATRIKPLGREGVGTTANFALQGLLRNHWDVVQW